MKAFSALYRRLDETNKTSRKREALVDYFRAAPPESAAWAVFILTGRKIKRALPTSLLRAWARERAGLPEWLFEESYQAVGDLAETVALLLPPAANERAWRLPEFMAERVLALSTAGESERRALVEATWNELSAPERFLFNKLLTGGLRVGVSEKLVIQALAEVAGVPAEVIAHRVTGDWQPTGAFYHALIARETSDALSGRPYPFYLASQLERPESTPVFGPDWSAEWKWDGIRAQLIRRENRTTLWSRGEEMVTPAFPELEAAAEALPNGCVLDGEVLVWNNGPLPFGALQRRLGRKNPGKTLLRDAPVILMAYDLLEYLGADIREQPLAVRRERLRAVLSAVASDRLLLSPALPAESFAAVAALRAKAAAHGAEGVMLKRVRSPYRVGRVRGDWWKWKVDPMTVDAVLLYAQRGHGRRAGLYTDYSFGIWKNGELVPFAKAYSGLTDAEIREVDAFIRTHTVEAFGPVRTVEPRLVFELGFEGIRRSTRHKSGLAVRFPRILRRRTDKRPEEADTLERVLALLPEAGSDPEAGR
ncbi:MAG TPA: ATP-dependent DNA ligase [Kiritimatiellia bacterium]|nr:ATP-dependent DNA ligase [Kiritimatiellia bacterium]HMO99179.1 ATP-dependent DNA ligase [Kiritimatiellia bacterium]HMP95766.1 ATP-dependent DNA ligase [Kiritimatiellia bacterium]